MREVKKGEGVTYTSIPPKNPCLKLTVILCIMLTEGKVLHPWLVELYPGKREYKDGRH